MQCIAGGGDAASESHTHFGSDENLHEINTIFFTEVLYSYPFFLLNAIQCEIHNHAQKHTYTHTYTHTHRQTDRITHTHTNTHTQRNKHQQSHTHTNK